MTSVSDPSLDIKYNAVCGPVGPIVDEHEGAAGSHISSLNSIFNVVYSLGLVPSFFVNFKCKQLVLAVLPIVNVLLA